MARGLAAYTLQRALLAIPMLLILVTFVFFLLHVAPGDPVLALAPPAAPQATIDNMRHALGLDKPLWQQYVDYVTMLLHGTLGDSFAFRGVPVSQRILGILYFSVIPHQNGAAWALPSGSRGMAAHWHWGSHASPVAEPTGMNTVDSLVALDWAAFGDNLRHLILPATTLGLAIGGI